MSPTRRQVLASIAGIAAASTIAPRVESQSSLSTPRMSAEGIFSFRITEPERTCERYPRVLFAFDPGDDTLTLTVQHVCDETLSTTRIYDSEGCELILNLLEDVEEISAAWAERGTA
jgi:hypothetical protein